MVVENNVSIKSNSNLHQTGNTIKPAQYKVNPNGVDKTPNKDTVQLSTAKKVGIGAGIVATAVAIFCLLRGGKPSQKVIQEAEQALKNNTRTNNVATEVVQNTAEKSKMEMTEEAKKIYDDVASKLHKKTPISPEAIDKNLSSKSQKDSEDLEKLKEYFSQQSKDAAEKAAKEAEAKAVEETKVVEKPVKETKPVTETKTKRNTDVKPKDNIEIKKTLDPFHPSDTVSDTSAITKHHAANGFNDKIRNAVESRANNMEGLSEDEVKDVLSTEKLMSKLDKEFEQLPPLSHDCIVYKGCAESPIFKSSNKPFELMEKAKVGEVVVPDTAYTYTAFNRSLAEHWGGAGARMTDLANKPLRVMMYEIRLPKGAKVSRNFEHGGEVLMPRGAQYKVVDKKVASNGDMEVILEYILPNKK